MHDGGEGVVAAGGHVDVIVGVHGLLAAHFSSQQLDGAVGDDFVGVHVALRAGSRLPDYEREVVDEFEACDFLCGLDDCVADFGVQAVGHVDFCGGAF